MYVAALTKYGGSQKRRRTMNGSEVVIRTENLEKSFSIGGKKQTILDDLNLEIYKGDFTVIMGSSGAGKSTLLYSLSGMDKPSDGHITYCGKDITKMNDDKLAVFRRKHCGFVFQQVHLIDSMSVMDNVISTGMLTGQKQKNLKKKASNLFGKVGISQEMWDKYPNQLSGGEAQRVGIVRAVINDPKILFADEPTGQLNSASGQDVLDIFTEVHKNGQSIVMVTHDLKTALRGTRVIFLRDGGIVGEYKMSVYGTDDIKERRAGLQQFLDEQGW